MFNMSIYRITQTSLAYPTQYIINCDVPDEPFTIYTRYRNGEFSAVCTNGEYDENTFPYILYNLGCAKKMTVGNTNDGYMSFDDTILALKKLGYRINKF